MAELSRRHFPTPKMVAWGSAAALLLVPLVATRFGAGFAWDLADFVFAGGLMLTVGVACELVARATGNRACRAAVAVAVGTAVLLLWLNAAAGIVGGEDNPANRFYGGVIATGVAGSFLARFRPHGMAWALVATAAAQGAVAVVASIAGLGSAWVLTAMFCALWLLSAWLFRTAARAR